MATLIANSTALAINVINKGYSYIEMILNLLVTNANDLAIKILDIGSDMIT